MSKFIKKFNVEVNGKLGKNKVTLTVPVEVSLLDFATTQALEEAEHQGLKNAEVTSVTEVETQQYVQMELPFEVDSEEEYDSYEDKEDSFEEQAYTPYVANMANKESKDNCDCDGLTVGLETMQPEPEVSKVSGYKSYQSAKKQKEAEESLPPSFTPKINNSYTPYKTRVVPIDSKYKDFNFR